MFLLLFAYGKAYYLTVNTRWFRMGIPKITKQTELRDNLYKTLEDIATGGRPHLIPTKNGDVLIISKQEYEALLLEKELLKEFEDTVPTSEMSEARIVLKKLDKKFGFKR